ncbi:hypothetical protein [Actinomadura terrae]|nr:hypothetical protein [Actinomadura terrae]
MSETIPEPPDGADATEPDEEAVLAGLYGPPPVEGVYTGDGA